MARSRRTTAPYVSVDLLAHSPRRVSLLVGLAAWTIFGAIANSPLRIPNPPDPSDMTRALTGKTIVPASRAALYNPVQ